MISDRTCTRVGFRASQGTITSHIGTPSLQQPVSIATLSPAEVVVPGRPRLRAIGLERETGTTIPQCLFKMPLSTLGFAHRPKPRPGRPHWATIFLRSETAALGRMKNHVRQEDRDLQRKYDEMRPIQHTSPDRLGRRLGSQQ